MAAANITNKVMKAWYEMGTAGSLSVPLYRGDVPAAEEGNYVLLRVESETDNTNNSKFVTNPVIITDVVTKFRVAVKDGVAADIDSELATLLFPSPGQLGLPVQSGIQITEVVRSNATYLYEDDGAFRYHRLITRNRHRVVQTATHLGPELITNGTFTGNANDWTLLGDVSYSANKLLFAATGGLSFGQAQQSGIDLVAGHTYRISWDMTGTTGGVAFSIGSSFPFYAAAVQSVTFDLVYNGVNPGIIYFQASEFDGTIDNVSIKQI